MNNIIDYKNELSEVSELISRMIEKNADKDELLRVIFYSRELIDLMRVYESEGIKELESKYMPEVIKVETEQPVSVLKVKPQDQIFAMNEGFAVLRGRKKIMTEEE